MYVFHLPEVRPSSCRRCGSHELYEDHYWHLWCNACDAWNGIIRYAEPLSLAQRELPYCSPNGEADIL
jgi:hypothetical protein